MHLGATGARTPWNGPWTCHPQRCRCTQGCLSTSLLLGTSVPSLAPQKQEWDSTQNSCLELTAGVTCGIKLAGKFMMRQLPHSSWLYCRYRPRAKGLHWRMSSPCCCRQSSAHSWWWDLPARTQVRAHLLRRLSQTAFLLPHEVFPCISNSQGTGPSQTACGHCSLLCREGLNISQHAKKSNSIFPLYLIWTILLRASASSNKGLTTGVPSGWCST